MLSMKLIRENPQLLFESLEKRNYPSHLASKLLDVDKEWRTLKTESDKLKSEKNILSKNISLAKESGRPIDDLLETSKQLSKKIEEIDNKLKLLEEEMNYILLSLPNFPDKSVKVGKDENDNVEIRKVMTPKKTSKDVMPHYEVSKKLIDFERGAKLAGHRFVVLYDLVARLERALINYMLDLHTMKGYKEVLPPFMVNSKAMTGTGQLPKFEEELYKCKDDDLYLIPTAEVPLVNLYSNEILKEEQLPIKLCAYTPCFRREAGNYQKDIKGIIRQHQFDKVELIKFCKPEDSFNELEKLTADAEDVLKKLELPYRVVELCSGDLGFASAKTYDIEVWIPSQDKYREISSCSNCTDFQARRANIKYFKANKLEFVHILNGSGLAVGRCMVAIIENYQEKDGFVVPKVLRDYMRCDFVSF
jgi:seryl-tRNA synthetase